jgi:hypothetical protein
MHLDENEGRRRPFQAKISDTTPPYKRPPLKAASSGTGLALALLELPYGQSFVSISTPERLLDATQLIGFSPRLLEWTKLAQMRVLQATHSDQERCRVAQKFFVAAQSCL